MKSSIAVLVAFLSVIGLPAAPAAADALELRPRLQPGSTYPLSLRVDTRTEASSSGEAGSSHAEDVRLHYRASVTVIAVDGDGRPVRELHEGVSLTYERPDETGSLFKPGAAFEVRREGAIEIHVGRDRLPPRAEKAVADVLAKQFEYTLEPALLAPARGVEVGDSWTPDASLVRRYLLSRGVRVLELGEEASATLRRASADEGGDGLVIEYRIPIERFELREMPRQVELGRTDAALTGWVQLAADAAAPPVAALSRLVLDLNGTSNASPRAHPWSLRSTETVERRARPLDEMASAAGSPR